MPAPDERIIRQWISEDYLISADTEYNMWPETNLPKSKSKRKVFHVLAKMIS